MTPFSGDRVSCSPDLSRINYMAEDSLELFDHPAFASNIVRLQVCVPMPGLKTCYNHRKGRYFFSSLEEES